MATSTPATSNPPGSFSWIELGTTDQSAAKSFYGKLFGWDFNDVPMGPDSVYTMFKLKGLDVAATYTLRDDQAAHGVRPHWMIYVATASADETAKKATDLGGTVIMPPFDVFDAGRMGVLRDPTGAVVSVWQAGRHAGVGISSSPGALCWADLSTPDRATAKSFYSALFGWQIIADERDPAGYLHIKNHDAYIGGIPPAAHRNPNIPPHWLAYFQVENCDASTRQAESLGATVHLAPTTMENVGRLAVIADPQAATFSIFEPAPRKH